MGSFVWLIPVIPLLGALVNGVFGRWIKERAGLIANLTVFTSFILSLIAFNRVRQGELFNGDYFTWIKAGNFEATFGLQVDPLSIVMMLVVTGVGFLIHLYSIGYMHGDPGIARYFSFLNLFIFSMLIW